MKRLVSYSSSDEDEDREIKRLRRPPLPPLSPSLLPVIPMDNPALHQGRTRSIPYVEGQWAAYVYVPLAIERWNKLGNVLKEVICTVKQVVEGLHVMGDNNDEDAELHISLTRPIYLRAHQREDLKKAVRAIARNYSVFTASFSNFASLKNDEQTRTFLAMEIGAGHAQLKEISDSLKCTLESLRQKGFYDSPRFHASFAWVLLSPQTARVHPQSTVSTSVSPSPPSCPHDTFDSFPAISEFPPSLTNTLNASYRTKLADCNVGTFEVAEVKVRIGKEIFGWRLQDAHVKAQ